MDSILKNKIEKIVWKNNIDLKKSLSIQGNILYLWPYSWDHNYNIKENYESNIKKKKKKKQLLLACFKTKINRDVWGGKW